MIEEIDQLGYKPDSDRLQVHKFIVLTVGKNGMVVEGYNICANIAYTWYTIYYNLFKHSPYSLIYLYYSKSRTRLIYLNFNIAYNFTPKLWNCYTYNKGEKVVVSYGECRPTSKLCLLLPDRPSTISKENRTEWVKARIETGTSRVIIERSNHCITCEV